MVTTKQIIKGAARWIDTELLSAMQGATQYAVAAGSVLLSRWAEPKLEALKISEQAALMGVVRDGGFDYDLLRQALVDTFPADGIHVEADQINGFIAKFLGKLGPILNFQVQGGITFRRADMEKLFDYIKEA